MQTARICHHFLISGGHSARTPIIKGKTLSLIFFCAWCCSFLPNVQGIATQLHLPKWGSGAVLWTVRERCKETVKEFLLLFFLGLLRVPLRNMNNALLSKCWKNSGPLIRINMACCIFNLEKWFGFKLIER